MNEKPASALSITVEDAIRVLNEAVALDPEAITALCDHRVACADGFREHPSIQVGWWPKDGSAPEPGSPNAKTEGTELRLGLLGLLNGLFGVDAEGWGFIAAIYEGGKIVRFEQRKGDNGKPTP